MEPARPGRLPIQALTGDSSAARRRSFPSRQSRGLERSAPARLLDQASEARPSSRAIDSPRELLKEEAGPLMTGRLLLLGRRCCYEVRRGWKVCGAHLNES